MPGVENIGKLCTLIAHARFDERGQEKLAKAELMGHCQTKGAKTVTVKAQDLEDKQPPSRSGQDFLNPSVAGQATAGFAVGHLPIFISALTQRGAFFFAESAS